MQLRSKCYRKVAYVMYSNCNSFVINGTSSPASMLGNLLKVKNTSDLLVIT